MNLLEMSFTGGVLIAVIVAFRALTLQKLPKSAFLALWWLAIARLLVPFRLTSPVSVYSLAERGAALPTASEGAVQVTADGLGTALPVSPVAEAGAGIDPLPVIWGMAAVLLGIFFASAYLRCRRRFAESLPVRNEFVEGWLAAHSLTRRISVRRSEYVTAPLTYGVFRPVILLPKSCDMEDTGVLDCILLHEWVHICRFDGLTKLLVIAAVCLHWFNPLVWVMYVLCGRDIELACDEAVVCRLGEPRRAAYARALIHMEEVQSGFAPLCSRFSQNEIEERIVAIMKMKRRTKRAMAASAAAVLMAGALFATSAAVSVPETTVGDGASAAGEMPFYPATKADFKEEGELLTSYEKFGISYDAAGKMYFHGQPVRWFWDGYDIVEDGEVIGRSIRYEYLSEKGTVDVHAVHAVEDNGDGSVNHFGALTAITAYSQAEFDARDLNELLSNRSAAATEAYELAPDDGELVVEEGDAVRQVQVSSPSEVSTATAVETENWVEGGRTHAEIFAQYKDFGVTYEEKDGAEGKIRNVYYNGELVKSFIDVSEKGTFTFGSTGAGTLVVRTVYDTNGKLIGVEPVQS